MRGGGRGQGESQYQEEEWVGAGGIVCGAWVEPRGKWVELREERVGLRDEWVGLREERVGPKGCGWAEGTGEEGEIYRGIEGREVTGGGGSTRNETDKERDRKFRDS